MARFEPEKVAPIDRNHWHKSNRYIQSDTTNVFVFTNQGKTLALDNNLSVTKTIAYKDLSVYYEQAANYKFITKEKNTLIVNNEGKKLQKLKQHQKRL